MPFLLFEHQCRFVATFAQKYRRQNNQHNRACTLYRIGNYLLKCFIIIYPFPQQQQCNRCRNKQGYNCYHLLL